MNKIEMVLEQHVVGLLLNKKIDLALSVHGINFTEFVIIYQLSLAQDLSLNRISLADKVGLTASGVTRVLQPMEKNGLIEKLINPRDARQSLVTLTSAGKELLRNSMTTVQHTVELVFSLLTQDELSTLKLLLNKLKV